MCPPVTTRILMGDFADELPGKHKKSNKRKKEREVFII
jgi:hypothetical protein